MRISVSIMGLFPETFETDRLRFERLCRENVDVLDFYRICAADDGIDEVARYMPWEPHRVPKETVEFLEHVEDRWEEGEGAEWILRPKEGEDGAGQLAGTTDFVVDWDRRSVALGIWLRKRFWGRGYSAERAGALLELAFGRLDLDVVCIAVEERNDRSIRAIEKYVDDYGGTFEGTLRNFDTNCGTPVDKRRYTISKDEYLESRPEHDLFRRFDQTA